MHKNNIKRELKCKFCKKKIFEYELINGKFTYEIKCPRCKIKNIGIIIDKTKWKFRWCNVNYRKFTQKFFMYGCGYYQHHL